MNPALVCLLGKVGIEATASLPVIIEAINRRLDEQYDFSRPHFYPWPQLNVGFKTVPGMTRTVGARSFALQRGTLKGWWYRIVERRNFWTTWYFVQAQYESEQDAVAHWDGFMNLLEAREEASKVLAQG